MPYKYLDKIKLLNCFIAPIKIGSQLAVYRRIYNYMALRRIVKQFNHRAINYR